MSRPERTTKGYTKLAGESNLHTVGVSSENAYYAPELPHPPSGSAPSSVRAGTSLRTYNARLLASTVKGVKTDSSVVLPDNALPNASLVVALARRPIVNTWEEHGVRSGAVFLTFWSLIAMMAAAQENAAARIVWPWGKIPDDNINTFFQFVNSIIATNMWINLDGSNSGLVTYINMVTGHPALRGKIAKLNALSKAPATGRNKRAMTTLIRETAVLAHSFFTAGSFAGLLKEDANKPGASAVIHNTLWLSGPATLSVYMLLFSGATRNAYKSMYNFGERLINEKIKPCFSQVGQPDVAELNWHMRKLARIARMRAISKMVTEMINTRDDELLDELFALLKKAGKENARPELAIEIEEKLTQIFESFSDNLTYNSDQRWEDEFKALLKPGFVTKLLSPLRYWKEIGKDTFTASTLGRFFVIGLLGYMAMTGEFWEDTFYDKGRPYDPAGAAWFLLKSFFYFFPFTMTVIQKAGDLAQGFADMLRHHQRAFRERPRVFLSFAMLGVYTLMVIGSTGSDNAMVQLLGETWNWLSLVYKDICPTLIGGEENVFQNGTDYYAYVQQPHHNLTIPCNMGSDQYQQGSTGAIYTISKIQTMLFNNAFTKDGLYILLQWIGTRSAIFTSERVIPRYMGLGKDSLNRTKRDIAILRFVNDYITELLEPSSTAAFAQDAMGHLERLETHNKVEQETASKTGMAPTLYNVEHEMDRFFGASHSRLNPTYSVDGTVMQNHAARMHKDFDKLTDEHHGENVRTVADRKAEALRLNKMGLFSKATIKEDERAPLMADVETRASRYG